MRGLKNEKATEINSGIVPRLLSVFHISRLGPSTEGSLASGLPLRVMSFVRFMRDALRAGLSTPSKSGPPVSSSLLRNKFFACFSEQSSGLQLTERE